MKKAKHIVLSAILITICLFTLNVQAETEILYGDANGDGAVDVRDSTLVQRYFANLEIPEPFNYEAKKRIDVDRNNKLTINDVKLIRSKVASIIDLPVMMGDVNGDGVVDALDATDIQKYTVGRIEFDDKQLLIADVNGDDEVNVLDAIEVQEYVSGMITSLPKIDGIEIVPDESEAEADPTVPAEDEPTNTQSNDKEEVVNVADTLATIPIIISVILMVLIAVGGAITSIVVLKKQDNKKVDL